MIRFYICGPAKLFEDRSHSNNRKLLACLTERRREVKDIVNDGFARTVFRTERGNGSTTGKAVGTGQYGKQNRTVSRAEW